jgi:UrcA family protein
MTRSTATALLSAIALAASGLGASTALAQTGGVMVKTDDLDLTGPAGRATLERRIVSAERQLCMSATATGSRSRAAQEQKACKAEVRRQIEARIPAARQSD